MPTRPDTVVAVVIRRAKGVRHPGMWAPPQDKVEAGERQADAVIREMREEIGLEVRPILQVWECLSADGTHTLHWWLSDCEKGALRPDPREVSDAAWWTPKKFAEASPTFETDREFFGTVFPHIEGNFG